MSVYIAQTDADFNLQLKNFILKIPNHSAVLGVTPDQITSLKADSLAFDYSLNYMINMQTYAHHCTEYKTELRHGGTQNLGAYPILPALGVAPAAVPANIEKRFRIFLQGFVHNDAYNLAIGQDLGIVEPPSTFNPANGKPVFVNTLTALGHPQLSYTKGDFDGVEIWKDTGSGFLVLQRITQTTFIDTSALPAAGIAAVWKYKMVFLYKDLEVGSFSNIVSVTVNGQTGLNPTTGTTQAPVSA